MRSALVHVSLQKRSRSRCGEQPSATHRSRTEGCGPGWSGAARSQRDFRRPEHAANLAVRRATLDDVRQANSERYQRDSPTANRRPSGARTPRLSHRGRHPTSPDREQGRRPLSPAMRDTTPARVSTSENDLPLERCGRNANGNALGSIDRRNAAGPKPALGACPTASHEWNGVSGHATAAAIRNFRGGAPTPRRPHRADCWRQ